MLLQAERSNYSANLIVMVVYWIMMKEIFPICSFWRIVYEYIYKLCLYKSFILNSVYTEFSTSSYIWRKSAATQITYAYQFAGSRTEGADTRSNHSTELKLFAYLRPFPEQCNKMAKRDGGKF